MRLSKLVLSLILMTGTVAVPVLFTGCTTHVDNFNSGEAPYYSRWESETHRSHEDFNKRNSDEQKQYWDWRHNQH